MTLDRALAELDATGRVALPGRPVPVLLLWLVCLAFAAIGVAMVVIPLTNLPFGTGRRDNLFTVITGAVGFLFFGVLGTIALPTRARRQGPALVLDRVGLHLDGRAPVHWGTVRGLHVSPQRGVGVMLMVDPTRTHPWVRGQSRVMPHLSWREGGYAVYIPALKGLRPEQVVTLIDAAGQRLG